MTADWDEYVEALRTLGRAPAALDERSRRIDDQETAARARADEALGAVEQAADDLDRRLAEVSATADRVLAESGAVADGAVAEVTLPTVTSLVAAAAVVDRVERQLTEDATALAESRALRDAALARRRKLVAIVVLAVAAVVLGALVSFFV